MISPSSPIIMTNSFSTIVDKQANKKFVQNDRPKAMTDESMFEWMGMGDLKV